jgi:hypothetical protein
VPLDGLALRIFRPREGGAQFLGVAVPDGGDAEIRTATSREKPRPLSSPDLGFVLPGKGPSRPPRATRPQRQALRPPPLGASEVRSDPPNQNPNNGQRNSQLPERHDRSEGARHEPPCLRFAEPCHRKSGQDGLDAKVGHVLAHAPVTEGRIEDASVNHELALGSRFKSASSIGVSSS